ncbi:MAG: ankyrin repeat domain-containing protein, partial [Planctomycetota bacterium]
RIGMTPLMAAASIGRGEHVEMLLAKGAKLQAKDSRGRTALDFARKRKHEAVVKLLEQVVKNSDSP